jgi:hypothetical protein
MTNYATRIVKFKFWINFAVGFHDCGINRIGYLYNIDYRLYSNDLSMGEHYLFNSWFRPYILRIKVTFFRKARMQLIPGISFRFEIR